MAVEPHQLLLQAQDQVPVMVAQVVAQAERSHQQTRQLLAQTVEHARRPQPLVVVRQVDLEPTALPAAAGTVAAAAVLASLAALRTTVAQAARRAVAVAAGPRWTATTPVPVHSAAAVFAASGLGKGAACAHIKSTPTA